MKHDFTPILKVFDVTLRQVKSRSRKPVIVEARQACMAFLIRKGCSTKQAAAYFGMAHNTASRGNKRFNQFSDIYPEQRMIDREVIPQMMRVA